MGLASSVPARVCSHVGVAALCSLLQRERLITRTTFLLGTALSQLSCVCVPLGHDPSHAANKPVVRHATKPTAT